MVWQWLFFSFEGRISRKPFWIAVIIFMIINALANRLDAGIFSNDLGTGPISGLLGLLLIWPTLAVAAKRWHDRNKSAWWILINLVPLIGWLWSLIETGFLAGTPGDNRFGPDPLVDINDNWRT